jgi:hypothetical protein
MERIEINAAYDTVSKGKMNCKAGSGWEGGLKSN